MITNQLLSNFKTIVANRLLQEWQAYGKIIIAVDFDDTIYKWKIGDTEVINFVTHVLKEAKSVGALIVIFTACNPDRFDFIKEYCKQIGLEVDSINSNPINLPYGNNGSKIYYNILIDDRAGFSEAITLLYDTIYKYKGQKATERTFNQIF